MCSGLLIASNTRCRGAANTRIIRISRSDGVVTVNDPLFATVPAAMFLLLGLQLLDIRLEAIEALFPHRAIALGPLGHFLEPGRFQPARSPLRLTAARDEPGALEHPEVL